MNVVALRSALARPDSSTERFALLLDGLLEAVWLVDASSHRIVAVNEAATQLLGSPAAVLMGCEAAALACTPEDALFWADATAGNRAPLCSDTMVRDARGQMLWVTRRISFIDLPGEPLWLVSLRDQSAQRQQQEERETLVAELRATLESTADAILVTDLAGRMRSFNQRFASLWGIPEDLLRERDDEAVRAWMRRSVVDSAAYQKQLDAIEDAPLLQSSDMLTLLDGRVIERVSLPQFSRERPIGRVYSFRDLSEKIAANQRIEELSHTDMLTDLPNRRALKERLATALARKASFALLNVDLDRFKQINDTLGQSYGDRVLKEVSERLKTCVRTNDLVARLAGDEFLLLVEPGTAREAEATARRVQEAMARPFSFDTLNFTVTCSTGIALFSGDGPRDGASEDELLASAERAMHWVKESGRGSFRFHQPRKDVDLLSRMRIDHAMRRALAEREFKLHYQPQFDLRTGRVLGAEALIRWRDPLRGEISPAEFIPVAEESGFIVAIGEWVLETAVQQAAQWLRQGRRLPVAVNVSALQFQQADFADTVAAALQAAALPAELLELELTESVLLSGADEAQHRMQQLRRLGVNLSIDDFGTGYSSFGYLKHFPIQRLKIDRSFVSGLPDDASDAGIVNAIVQMGRALGLQVIAEGVENAAQRDFLLQAGCHEVQGFLYAPALDPRAFVDCVWRQSAAPAVQDSWGFAGL